MKKHNNRLRSRSRSSAISIRLLTERAAAIFLISISVVLIIMSKNDSSLIKNTRNVLSDVFTPAISFLSAPAEFISEMGYRIDGWLNVYSENARLTADNERLLRWQAIAMRLEEENKQLRKLLGAEPPPTLTYITARIVGGKSHFITHKYTLNKGKNDGIEPHMAVITAEGLVGHIIEVGNNSSKILAITDINSRIPVIGEESQEKAILAGNNSSKPELLYLSEKHGLRKGERILTSQYGNVIPEGIVVGEVTDIREDKVLVSSYIDSNRLNFVRVVKKK